jgi:DNA-directed RNA polymerase specialized sigma24 family protein
VTRSLDEPYGEDTTLAEVLDLAEPEPADHERLVRALAAMNPHEVEAVVRRHVDGESYRQIGVAMGVSTREAQRICEAALS